LAAGRKKANSGGFLQDHIRQDGDGVEWVLAVVEDKECFARGDVGTRSEVGHCPDLSAKPRLVITAFGTR